MKFPFLSSHGVLGINARNLLYIKPFNPRKAVAFADDKLKTKAYLAARGIPAAKIYARIETRDQLHSFDFSQLPDTCVLKPNYGYGGEGIIILKGRDKKGRFLRRGKQPMTSVELVAHIEDILDGKFSLGGRFDTAFFEQILIPHECFARFRPVGLPDIRVIVFNLVPVMAMLRIPTASSEGKANIHLGGIGIGINIAKGVTTHAAQYHNIIDELPHGGSPAGMQIPYWDEILLICSRIQQITNIGYLAVDIVIDEQMGPAVLEVNARAGLMVQVANLAPLRARLERVQGLSVSSPEKGVRIGQDLFGEKIKAPEKEVEEEQPKLGTQENIIIAGDGTTIEVTCHIDLDEERTIFSTKLIEELKGKKIIEVKDEKEQTYRVKFTLGGKKIQTLVTVGTVPGAVRAIIGRRDLKGFLIDPTKKEVATKLEPSVKTDLRAVDKLLAQIDRELLLLKHLKPTNLAEERIRLQEDKRYNPIFTLPEVTLDIEETQKRLSEPVQDDSPLGILLEKKRCELLKRMTLLQARGDAERFTQASKELFGEPVRKLTKAASKFLAARIACDLPPPEKELITAEKAVALFQEVLKRYGLHDWEVSVRQRLVADCTVGGNNIYLREGAKFSRMHIDALIAHEIETHVLTAENGEHQPVALLRRGCANYLDTQEGLATYNQNYVLSPYHEKCYGPARSVLAVEFGLKHSFADTREYLEDRLGYTPEKALVKAIDVKRGLTDTSEPGGFTKGIVYFRGLCAIRKFVEDGGDLKRLYIGKVALEDLELIEQIPDLQPPLIIPSFLREEKDN